LIHSGCSNQEPEQYAGGLAADEIVSIYDTLRFYGRYSPPYEHVIETEDWQQRIGLEPSGIDSNTKYLHIIINSEIHAGGPRAIGINQNALPGADDLYQQNEIGLLSFDGHGELNEDFDFSYFPELREVWFTHQSFNPTILKNLLTHAKKLRGIKVYDVDALPDCICDLENLEYIIMNSPHSIDLPNCMAKMPNLKMISLAQSGNTLDSTIWEISALELLKIPRLPLDTIPSNAYHLSNLKSLELGFAEQLHFPEVVKHWKNLEYFEVSDGTGYVENDEEYRVPYEGISFAEEFNDLVNLKGFQVSWAHIKKFPDFTKMTQLVHIYVDECILYSCVNSDFTNHNDLRFFAINCKHYAPLSCSSIPKGLDQLESLDQLYMKNVHVKQIPAGVGSYPYLQVLILPDSELSYENAKQVYKNASAREISLNHTGFSQPECDTLASVVRSNPKILRYGYTTYSLKKNYFFVHKDYTDRLLYE